MDLSALFVENKGVKLGFQLFLEKLHVCILFWGLCETKFSNTYLSSTILMQIRRTGLLSCKQNNALLGLEAACCLTGRRLLIVLTVLVAAKVEAQALLTLLLAAPAIPVAAVAPSAVPAKITGN